MASDIWTRRDRAERWRQRGEAVGGCIGVVLAIGLVLGAAGGLLYLVVRIVAVAWGRP